MEKIKFTKSDGYSVKAIKNGKVIKYISKNFVLGGWRIQVAPLKRFGCATLGYKNFNTLKEAKEYIVSNY